MPARIDPWLFTSRIRVLCHYRQMAVRWYESERLDRWYFTVASVLLIVVIGPSQVGAVTSSPSAWDCVVFGIWVVAAVGSVVFAIRHWRNRNTPTQSSLAGSIDPADIPVADVQSAVSSHTQRISAIKMLREQHRGLGLKDAADLVDTELRRREIGESDM